MSDTLSTIQALRYLFALLLTFSVLTILGGTILSILTNIFTSEHNQREVQQLQQRFPQCIIIGAMKCGTKALIEFMGMHPNVKINRKDVGFFDKDENYTKGLEHYRAHMPYSYPEDITMEKTPSYFASEDAMKRIRDFNKDIKLIVILRNPITRSMSHFLQLRRKRLISVERFEDYIIDNVTGEVNVNGTPIIEPSLYVEHMLKWYQYFQRKQIYVVDGDLFVYNPVRQLQKVESFLGLKHWITDLDLYYDSNKGFYCMQVASPDAHCLGANKGQKHPEIDTVVLRKLSDFFRPYNRRLNDLLSRKFEWDITD